MSTILQGDLKHFALSELLRMLGDNRHSGKLHVEKDSRAADLLVGEGRVIFARTADALGKEAVLDLFTWDDGTFAFVTEGVLPDGAVAISLEINELIEEGEQHAAMIRGKQKLYPGDAIVLPVENPAGQVSLTPEAWKVLLRAAGGRSLNQLCADLGGDAAQIYPVIRNLEDQGLVRVERQVSTVRMEPPAQRAAQSSGAPIASLTGGTTDEVWPLIQDETSVGRVEANAISLNDSTVSSTHARVIRNAEGFWLEDLQSRNGTYVNGDRVTEKRLLADRDVIRFGRVIFTFSIASELVPTTTSAGSVPI